MYMWVGLIYVEAHLYHGMCVEVRFSLSTVWVLGVQNQIVRFSSKCLYLPSHCSTRMQGDFPYL